MFKRYMEEENADATGNVGEGSVTTETVDQTKSTDSGTVEQPAEKVAEKGYWPDDWREKASNGDEKLKARFSRYASPNEALKALIEAQNKISSGKFKTSLGEGASAEDIAAYRKENGIPEAPDKYDLNLGDGLVVGDEDKPYVNEFLKLAHETNQTPDQVKASLKAYFKIGEMMAANAAEKFKEAQDRTESSLREEWGADYKKYANAINNIVESHGENDPEFKELVINAAKTDQRFAKMLVRLALDVNPAATLVPGGGNQMGVLEDEISKIEKTMRENRAAYNKDEKMQARYRELLVARESMKERKAS